jgi:hypothetical protein
MCADFDVFSLSPDNIQTQLFHSKNSTRPLSGQAGKMRRRERHGRNLGGISYLEMLPSLSMSNLMKAERTCQVLGVRMTINEANDC